MQRVRFQPTSGSVMYAAVTLEEGMTGPQDVPAGAVGFVVTLFSHPFKVQQEGDNKREKWEPEDVVQVCLDSGECLWTKAKDFVDEE